MGDLLRYESCSTTELDLATTRDDKRLTGQSRNLYLLLGGQKIEHYLQQWTFLRVLEIFLQFRCHALRTYSFFIRIDVKRGGNSKFIDT